LHKSLCWLSISFETTFHFNYRFDQNWKLLIVFLPDQPLKWATKRSRIRSSSELLHLWTIPSSPWSRPRRDRSRRRRRWRGFRRRRRGGSTRGWIGNRGRITYMPSPEKQFKSLDNMNLRRGGSTGRTTSARIDFKFSQSPRQFKNKQLDESQLIKIITYNKIFLSSWFCLCDNSLT